MSTPYRLLNHLLTLVRASLLAPLTSRRATTSLWPSSADTMIGVAPFYPRQREGSEIVIIRDHIKPDLKKAIINIYTYIQTNIQTYLIWTPKDIIKCNFIKCCDSKYEQTFLLPYPYTNISYVVTYSYSIYIICTHIHCMHVHVCRRRHTYLYVWVWKGKKASPPPNIAKHRE